MFHHDPRMLQTQLVTAMKGVGADQTSPDAPSAGVRKDSYLKREHSSSTPQIPPTKVHASAHAHRRECFPQSCPYEPQTQFKRLSTQDWVICGQYSMKYYTMIKKKIILLSSHRIFRMDLTAWIERIWTEKKDSKSTILFIFEYKK